MFILSFCLTRLKYLDKIKKRKSLENSDTLERNNRHSYNNSLSNEFNMEPSINNNLEYILDFD